MLKTFKLLCFLQRYDVGQTIIISKNETLMILDALSENTTPEIYRFIKELSNCYLGKEIIFTDEFVLRIHTCLKDLPLEKDIICLFWNFGDQFPLIGRLESYKEVVGEGKFISQDAFFTYYVPATDDEVENCFEFSYCCLAPQDLKLILERNF